MKARNKRSMRRKKEKDNTLIAPDRTESELVTATMTTSKTTFDSKSSSEDESQENELSGIEAELPVGNKQKILLKDRGTIEIDRKRYVIDGAMKGDYGVVGLMERGNIRAFFALHYESQDSTLKRLQVEIDVLKSSTKFKKLQHIVPMLSQGKNLKINIQYFTTKMIGETIKDLHERFGEFSTATSLKISYLSIEGLEEIHRIGFVHRDIKPSVYAIGLEAESSHLFLLGFGLARRYRTMDKAPVKKRTKVHRMGNIRYMPRSCHKYLERSRKDDVESWLYMTVELFLTTSSLPWDEETNHDKVLKRKEIFMTTGFQKIFKKCKGLPMGIYTIVRQLNASQYETVPDYHLIKNIFRNAIIQGNYKTEKLDWLKGKEGGMLPAGACESKIFGEKTEKTEQEQEPSRRFRKVEKEREVKSNREQQRSVFMMPRINPPQQESAHDSPSLNEANRSSYLAPSISANEQSFLSRNQPQQKSKGAKKKKKKKIPSRRQ